MNMLIQPHSSLRVNGRALTLCAIYPLDNCDTTPFCSYMLNLQDILNHKGVTQWIINYEGLRR